MRVILTIMFIVVNRTVSQICNYQNSVELTNRIFNGVIYKNNEYFVDNKTGVERGCVCLKEICARKCCPLGQIFNETNFKCNEYPEEFNPPIWEGSKLKQGLNFTVNFHVFPAQMRCNYEKNESKIILGDHTKDFRLKTDGKLYVRMETTNPVDVYGPDKYCIDNFLDFATSTIKLNALLCYVATATEEKNHYVLSAVCMLVSCFFVIITVVVYAFLPDLRCTIHGKVMIAYLSSFFVGWLLMATMLLLLLVGYISRSGCTILSIIIYFALMASFFWLNVMSYDIFRKFNKINVNSTDRLRFLWYCAYAFGIPIAFTILLVGLEFSGLPKENTLLPNIRDGRCFLYGSTRLIYLYIPMTLLCIANLILYLLVSRRISQIKKQTQRIRKDDRQQVCLYIKLFIVAGVNWILEMVSSFYPDLDLWQFTDAYNILCGVLIFIIFVCKKKILVSVYQRYKQLRDQRKEHLSLTLSTPVTNSSALMEDVGMSNVDARREV